MAKPISIIAHVEGSGTAATGSGPRMASVWKCQVDLKRAIGCKWTSEDFQSFNGQGLRFNEETSVQIVWYAIAALTMRQVIGTVVGIVKGTARHRLKNGNPVKSGSSCRSGLASPSNHSRAAEIG